MFPSYSNQSIDLSSSTNTLTGFYMMVVIFDNNMFRSDFLDFKNRFIIVVSERLFLVIKCSVSIL